MRIFVFTAGSSLTAQQPLNNVVRTTVEAIAAALAGVQTMHVCAYDEAVGVPTEAAATLALRTQQIVAFETGLTETVDPFGGSHAIEALTDRDGGEHRGAAGRDRVARRRPGLHRVGLVPGRDRRIGLPPGAGGGGGGEARDRRQPVRVPL